MPCLLCADNVKGVLLASPQGPATDMHSWTTSRDQTMSRLPPPPDRPSYTDARP